MIRRTAALLGTLAWAGCGGMSTMHLGDTGTDSGMAGAGGQTVGSGGQDTGGSSTTGMGGSMTMVPADAGMAPACALNAGQSVPLAMTNFEYDNTVRDLLGDTSAIATTFAPDPLVAGFRAESATLSMLRTSQYVSAASNLAVNAIAPLLQGHLVLLPCNPATVGEDACAGQFIASFGRRAFRRPLSPSETAEMQQIYANGRVGNDFIRAIGGVIETMLASPRFYEIEPKGATPSLAQLDPFRLASRLSYFIWRSMPDDHLLAAAEGGNLVTKADVEREAKRMLTDPKAHTAIISFFSEWLGLDRLSTVTKDPAVIPNFDALRGDMVTETTKFVESTFFGDGQFQSLLQSSTTWVNAPLAELYAQPGVVGPFQEVKLNPQLRAGILTQASFLSINADPKEGSITRRGRFVGEQVLCVPVPPPPSVHNMTLPDKQPGQTNRERYESAFNQPICAACHNLMYGTGFEEFDTVGRYRSTDNGLPVDATGDLVGTAVDGIFKGAVELSAKLASSTEAQECAARQWFRFALSRAESGEDACSIEAAKQTLASSGNLRDLVVTIATSDSFRHARW